MAGHVEVSRYIARSDGDGVSVTASSLHIESAQDPSADCFDPATCCDERERRVIEELRAYLRPTTAPACLIDRLQHMFDDLDG
ncbi:hypothetical protein [Bifidobacterium favimelis]|uniref:Uncharacterized protein n=1 Tax=Bifidobacterium favimelis TaxID=3122979 RepID=A0ABU8ZNN7_9BIFI